MPMSTYSKSWLVLLLLSTLVACSTVPEAPLQPAPAMTEDLPDETDQVEPEIAPVDFNQQLYAEAVALLKHGNTEDALDLLLQVGRDAPDKPYVFTNLGLAYFKLKRFELAEEAFAQAIAINDRDAVAHNHLGILQRQKGQFENALKRYQRAIGIRRDYASAHLNLGILFDIYLQDLAKALRQYETYQALTNEEDAQVAEWIVDLRRRLKSGTNQTQG